MRDKQRNSPFWLFPVCFLIPFLLQSWGADFMGNPANRTWVVSVCLWAMLCWIVSWAIRDRYFSARPAPPLSAAGFYDDDSKRLSTIALMVLAATASGCVMAARFMLDSIWLRALVAS
jgi:hypothetical protein